MRSGTVRRRSVNAKSASALTHCTATNTTASLSCRSESRIAEAVCISLLATRPAKSFWKKPRLWRSMCRCDCQRTRAWNGGESTWLLVSS
jgi:hypothetical protein